MRKRLSIILCLCLVAGLVLIGTSCTCGTTSDDGNTSTPFQQLETRVGTLEGTSGNHTSRISTLEGTTAPDLSIYALRTELPTAPDLSGYVTKATYDALAARVTALEATQEDTGSSSSTSGEVSVVIDSNIDPYQFTTGVTPANAILPIKITNGTADYQEIKFNLTLQCVSSDGVANVTVDPVATVNAVGMTVTKVPTNPTVCQLIYFTWATSEKILVSPGGATIVYVSVTDFTTASSEVWQVTLSGILVNEL